MAYQNVWWYPNYIEYGTGLNPPRTWPDVLEQYRRPHAENDLRYYDIPTEEYESKLYYERPRLGIPKYRATFRDKPHLVPRHYPSGCPEGKPPGFYGRMYYEDGPPQFKYEGPKRDKLYWLEREPYLPKIPQKNKPGSAGSNGGGQGRTTTPTVNLQGPTTNSEYGSYYVTSRPGSSTKCSTQNDKS